MKWTINGIMIIDTPFPKAVAMVNFTISDTQNGLTGQVIYSLDLINANPENYVPYDLMTEAQVIAWTKEAAGADRIAEWEAEVQAKIDAQKIPVPLPAPLPWAVAE